MSITAANLGVRPLHPIKVALLDDRHGLRPVASERRDGGKFGSALPAQGGGKFQSAPDNGGKLQQAMLDNRGKLLMRRLAAFEALNHLESITGLKRDTIDLDSFGSKILGGLKSHGLNEYVGRFSARIQQLKDLPGDVPPSQITAGANSLLREYNQVLAGLRVNKPVVARDIEVNAQLLAQLQNFVSNTVNLLRALGKSDGKHLWASVHPRRDAELGFSS